MLRLLLAWAKVDDVGLKSAKLGKESQRSGISEEIDSAYFCSLEECRQRPHSSLHLKYASLKLFSISVVF